MQFNEFVGILCYGTGFSIRCFFMCLRFLRHILKAFMFS